MNASNLKDTLTSIAGIVIVIGGAIGAIVAAGVALPALVTQGAIIAVTIATALIGYLTGKTPAGTTKTDAQVADQNKPKP